MGTQQA
jgi:hypothetical protein